LARYLGALSNPADHSRNSSPETLPTQLLVNIDVPDSDGAAKVIGAIGDIESKPSPMVLTMGPQWAAILGLITWVPPCFAHVLADFGFEPLRNGK
jgi:hypothetical protein